MFLDTSPNKVLTCGRRWGKTEGGAVDDVTCLISIPYWTSMVVAPSRDQVMINYREAKQLLESIPDFAPLLRCRENPHPEIVLGDRMILYRTAGEDGKYIRGHGKKIQRIRVDEAAYIKQRVIEQVIEPMCLDLGAELILQGTPFGKNIFYERFREGDPSDPRYDGCSRSWRFPTSCNPHLDHRAFNRIKHRLGEDSMQWRCEYEAEFIDSAAAVFPWDLIESCFYDPYDDEGRRRVYSRYVGGLDIARYSDYTVAMIGGFDRGMIHVVDMVRFNEQDWRTQKAIIYDLFHKYDATGSADATGEGDAVVDDLRAGEWIEDDDGRVKARPGLRLEKVRITSNALKRELIDKLKLRMSQGLFKFPYGAADVDTGNDHWNVMVDEFKYYSYTMTETGRVTFSADSGYHDDTVMAAALMIRQVYGNFQAMEESRTYPPNSFGRVVAELSEKRRLQGKMVIGRN